jgi:hypothetical protein
MANGVRVSRSAIGIVTQVRCDERSSALLQSRPASKRYYLVAALSSRLSHAQTAGAKRRLRLKRRRAWPHDSNVVQSAASVTCGSDGVLFLRRKEFRFGDTVQAVQGGLLDVDVLAHPAAQERDSVVLRRNRANLQ